MLTATPELVARCPSCRSVVEHHAEGRYHRCANCHRPHDLLAELA